MRFGLQESISHDVVMMSSTCSTTSMHEERGVFQLFGPSEIHSDLLVLASVQNKVAQAPFHQVLNHILIVGLIIARHETHYSGITCKFHNHVCGMNSREVVREEGEESWAEHTTLWHACTQDQFVLSPNLTTRGLLVRTCDPKAQ